MAYSREAAVKILTEPPGFLAPSITDVGDPVQAIEVEISETGGIVRRLVIVHAHFPQQPIYVCDEMAYNLRPHFRDADIYFTVIDRQGEAEVYVPADQGRLDRFSVAAAVAVIKASWGWEEDNPVLVTVAGEAVSVQLEVVNRSWIAHMANAA